MMDSIRQIGSTRPRLALSSVLFVVITILLFRPFSPTPPVEDFGYPSHPHEAAINQTSPKRVAIIGAGASGSSAAWFLTRAGRVIEERMGVERGSLLEEVVVYDRETYVGGRTTTVYPHGDDRLRAIELGASIFVEANRHLVKGAKRFGLKTLDPDFGEQGIGIWDGHQFLYTTPTSTSWWSSLSATLSAIRRYGPMSPYRTTRAVNALLAKFENLYNPRWLAEHGAALDIEDFVERVGLGRELTSRRGEEWALSSVKVGKEWMGEIMEGSTRCNYASGMDQIHALGAGVSMATSGAKAVEGGNWRIFEGMLDECKPTRRLGIEVLDIVPLNKIGETPLFRVMTNDTSVTEEAPFDQIIYATPWFSSPMDRGLRGLQSRLVEPMDYQPYVRLHVTLLSTTRSSPLPAFFNLPPDHPPLPSTILTSSYTARTHAVTPPPRFHSITWHGETAPGSGEYVVKIFSVSYLNDKFLRELIGEEPGWLVRKEWDSYPKLRPNNGIYPSVEPVRGIQYLAALEPWVSTMETQTLSAREAVARVVNEWWALRYGECRGGADAWDWSCEE